MRKRHLVFAAVLGAMAVAAPAGAHHGEPGGHLPPTQANVDLVSRLQVSGVVADEVTDVATYRDTAFLGNWGIPDCPGGFWSVDISNPRAPRELGFVTAPHPDTYLTEGLHALRLTTPSFTGDVLVVSQESCTGRGAGGISIYDVTNAAAPVPLALSKGDTGGTAPRAHQSHSAFAWDAGARAFVALVDNEDGTDGDIDIMEITDPRNPVLIKETGLDDWPAAQDNFSFGAVLGVHDLIVRRVEGRWEMLASYWDAGYVRVDVTDPANPRYIADSDHPNTDPLTGATPMEGNAHEAEWDRCPEEGVRSRFPCGNVRYILGADEDFSPYRTGPFRITTGPNAGQYPSTGVGGAAPVSLLPDRKLNGPVVYGGYACPPPDSPPVPQRSAFNLGLAPGEEAILVVQRGPGGTATAPHDPSDPPVNPGGCFPGQKAQEAIEAGWDAVVFVNRHLPTQPQDTPESPPFCGSGAFPPSPPIVGVCTSHEAYHRMFNTVPDFSIPYDPEPNTEPDIGQRGERVSIEATFDGWGYLNLIDADTMRHIDHYAVPEALDERFAQGFGDLTIHEVTTDPTGDVGYIAWYSAGFRVVDFSGGRLREVGRFIAPEGNDFWGVELNVRRDGRLFTLLSDRDYGLYIFRFGTDLRPTKVSSPRTTRVGNTFSYRIGVGNSGTIAETNTVVRDRLPRGVRFVSASATQGRCSYRRTTRTVVCNLGRLNNDADRAFVTIRVEALRRGTLRNVVTIQGRKAEYDIGNNSARATTRVLPAVVVGGRLTGGR